MVRTLPATLAFALVGATLSLGVGHPASAKGSLFTATPVEEENFILVAAPIGKGESSQLNIYEQRTKKRPCFAVSASVPATVDPLLATFDFTGICNRYIDGNGYSIRIGADDFGTRYRLSVVKTNRDVELLAVPTRGGAGETHVVARAGGVTDGFVKLNLEPGWQLMRRQYGKRSLGHLYVFREVWPGSEPALAQPVPSESAQPLQPGEAPAAPELAPGS